MENPRAERAADPLLVGDGNKRPEDVAADLAADNPALAAAAKAGSSRALAAVTTRYDADMTAAIAEAPRANAAALRAEIEAMGRVETLRGVAAWVAADPARANLPLADVVRMWPRLVVLSDDALGVLLRWAARKAA